MIGQYAIDLSTSNLVCMVFSLAQQILNGYLTDLLGLQDENRSYIMGDWACGLIIIIIIIIIIIHGIYAFI